MTFTAVADETGLKAMVPFEHALFDCIVEPRVVRNEAQPDRFGSGVAITLKRARVLGLWRRASVRGSSERGSLFCGDGRR